MFKRRGMKAMEEVGKLFMQGRGAKELEEGVSDEAS